MPQTAADLGIRWDNSYAQQLPAFYVACEPSVVPDPTLLRFNTALAQELGFDTEKLDTTVIAKVFSGSEVPAGAQPLAQAYAGHQFGGFVPQLGDGRALLLGEVVDSQGRRKDIALKGSGRTPFSRGGDGKAAVGPVLREYLIGEAMHALGIPTTRALAAVGTGERVARDRPLPGAVLTRVAASHIRVGTFQFFAARQQHDQVRTLADYVIQRHFPELSSEADRYLLLLKAIAERQAALLAEWMLAGFIHGVMNTDNAALSGETIDYGPCAFLETYSPRAVFSSIDAGGRYAFGNQPVIAAWNLARLAETLLFLIDPEKPERAVEQATAVIDGFPPRYEIHWLSGVRRKLGLAGRASDDDDADRRLAEDWLQLLEQHSVDFTLGWRRLADAAEDKSELLEVLFPNEDAVRPWLERWRRLRGAEAASGADIRSVNPVYIPRNHLVEEALDSAVDHADLAQFEQLLDVVRDPYVHKPGLERYAQPAPREFTQCYKTFCGT